MRYAPDVVSADGGLPLLLMKRMSLPEATRYTRFSRQVLGVDSHEQELHNLCFARGREIPRIGS